MERKTGKKLGAVLVVGTLLAGAGTVLAQPGGFGGGMDKEGFRAKMLERFDTNKDGKLDDTERQAARAEKKKMKEQHRQEMLSRFDANKDGQLDDNERKAMREQFAAERFKQLDTNGDGSLSLAEFQAAPMFGKGKHGRRGPR